MKYYSMALTNDGPVILRGMDSAHARPNYTPSDANTVVDWLNGADRPLARVNPNDRPMSIAERAADNATRAFNATYDANARRRGQYT